MTGTVVTSGVSTSVGLEATARQGTGLGFAFMVVEGVCGAMVVEEHEYAVKTIFLAAGEGALNGSGDRSTCLKPSR